MSLYIPERAKPIRTGSLFMLMAVNIGFAACVLWGWTVLHLLLGDAIGWATSTSLGSQPAIFEYPFLMLWLLPILATLVARVLGEAGSSRGAYTAALIPPSFFTFIVVLYQILPH